MFNSPGPCRPISGLLNVVDRLNADIGAVLKDLDVVKVLKEQSIDPVTSTPEEFARLISSEVDRWAKVVKESGARVE